MCNPLQEIGNLVNSVSSAVSSVANAAVKKVDSIVRNPLPTIETVALTYAFGPSGAGFSQSTAVAISQAAVAAANGGKIENIALNVAAAYVGGKIGGAIGAELPPETTALVKQVVTSASGAAATTALRGGNMQQVMASGIAGSVNAYVADSLQEQGFSKVDNRIISNAASAATNAILSGRSVADAIGNSVAASALTALIQDQVDQINKNNEIGNAIVDKVTSLSKSAEDFYTKNFSTKPADSVGYINAAEQMQVSTDYLNTRINNYNSILTQIDEDYKTYQLWLEKYNANPNNSDIANQLNNSADAYKRRIESANYYASVEIPEAQQRYDSTLSRYNQQVDKYNQNFLNPISDLTNKYQTLVSDNTNISKSLSDNVIKYQDTLETDYGELVKEIGSQAVNDAINVIQQPVEQPKKEEPEIPVVPAPEPEEKPVEPIPEEPVAPTPEEPTPEEPIEPAPEEKETPEEPTPEKPVEPEEKPAQEEEPTEPVKPKEETPPTSGLPDMGTIEIVGERPEKEPPEEEEDPYVPEIPSTPVTPPVTPTPVTPVTPTPVTPTPVTPTPVKPPVTPPVKPPVTPTPQVQPQSNLLGLLALLEKPQQQAPVQTPLADIKYYYDIMGKDILPPTPIQNLKPTFEYAEGGTIEDLIRILRS